MDEHDDDCGSDVGDNCNDRNDNVDDDGGCGAKSG